MHKIMLAYTSVCVRDVIPRGIEMIIRVIRFTTMKSHICGMWADWQSLTICKTSTVNFFLANVRLIIYENIFELRSFFSNYSFSVSDVSTRRCLSFPIPAIFLS